MARQMGRLEKTFMWVYAVFAFIGIAMILYALIWGSIEGLEDRDGDDDIIQGLAGLSIFMAGMYGRMMLEYGHLQKQLKGTEQ